MSIMFPIQFDSGTMARIEPNRKWFGNTRLISQDELDRFRTAVSTAKKDPYQVCFMNIHTGLSTEMEFSLYVTMW